MYSISEELLLRQQYYNYYICGLSFGFMLLSFMSKRITELLCVPLEINTHINSQ